MHLYPDMCILGCRIADGKVDHGNEAEPNKFFRPGERMMEDIACKDRQQKQKEIESHKKNRQVFFKESQYCIENFQGFHIAPLYRTNIIKI